MTIEERVAKDQADRLEWEKKTVGAKLSDGREVLVAELRAVFNAVCDEQNWKNPFAAPVRANRVELTVEAIKFFHGAEPTTTKAAGGFVIVSSPGYSC